MATVTFDHVFKRYGDVTAVNDLNLEIGDGEFMVLVGPSGCGKTTTLRMIAGLEEISEGTLRIGDRVVNNVAPKDRDIAMVFQSYALYPHMSVRDNLAFGLKLRKTPSPRSRSGSPRRPASSSSRSCSTASPRSCPAASDSASRSAGRSSASRPCSSWTSRCPTSTPSCASRPGPRSRASTSGSGTTVYVTHDQVEAMTMGQRIAVMSEACSSRSARRSPSTTTRSTASWRASSASRR